LGSTHENARLRAQYGLRVVGGFVLAIIIPDEDCYCIQGVHIKAGDVSRLESLRKLDL
jgi:hypothetical protein